MPATESEGTNIHEARLIQRAKREDPAAFAGIYDRCQPAVYRYVFYRVGEVGTAEDPTGEVFVRLVEGIDRCPQQASLLLAWLHSIAEDLVKDRYPSAVKPVSVVPHGTGKHLTFLPCFNGNRIRSWPEKRSTTDRYSIAVRNAA